MRNKRRNKMTIRITDAINVSEIVYHRKTNHHSNKRQLETQVSKGKV